MREKCLGSKKVATNELGYTLTFLVFSFILSANGKIGYVGYARKRLSLVFFISSHLCNSQGDQFRFCFHD